MRVLQNGIMYIGLFGLSVTLFLVTLGIGGPLIARALNRISKTGGYIGVLIFVSCCICCTINAQKRGSVADSRCSFKMRKSIQVDAAPNITNDTSYAGLRFTNIARSTNTVDLTISHPLVGLYANEIIDIYGNFALTSTGWQYFGGLYMDNSNSNVCASIAVADFYTNAMSTAAFFKAAVRVDSDRDGYSDATEELVYGTHPYEVDTDRDGLPDGWEIEHNYDPKVAGEYIDSDDDGLADVFELSMGLNPLAIDSDGDGLSDKLELKYGANPLLPDTDGDGVTDGVEYEWGSDPASFDDCYLMDSRNASKADYIDFNEVTNTLLISPEQTSTSNLNYQMVGFFDCTINFEPDYTSDFSVLGISPPSGSIELPGDFVKETWYSATAPGWKNKFNLLATGARFKPLKTGRFSFQAYADDTTTVSIGDVNPLIVTADYYGENNVTSAIFIAGLEYPVRIEARNNGGPTELRFPIWGEFESIERPSVKLAVSDDVVMFEPPYVNIPNSDVQPLCSSEVSVKVRVGGGSLGGQLKTESNSSRLRLVRGDECFGVNRFVNPSEVVELCGVYCAQSASVVPNDIVLSANIIECGTSEIFSATTAVTAVSVSVNASKNLYASSSRHIFGPLETAKIHVLPESVQREMVITQLEQQQGAVPKIESNGQFTASAFPSLARVQVRSGNSAFIELSMRSIMPFEIRGKTATVAVYDDWIAHNAGTPIEMWCAMKIPIRVFPRYVLFTHVEFREEIAPPVRCWGVFNDKNNNIMWHMSNSWNLDVGNGLYYDFASISGLQMTNGWQDGGYEYHIPQYWRPQGDDSNGYQLGRKQIEVQKYVVDGNGTVSIEKFGSMATRYTNGYYYVRGVER